MFLQDCLSSTLETSCSKVARCPLITDLVLMIKFKDAQGQEGNFLSQ